MKVWLQTKIITKPKHALYKNEKRQFLGKPFLLVLLHRPLLTYKLKIQNSRVIIKDNYQFTFGKGSSFTVQWVGLFSIHFLFDEGTSVPREVDMDVDPFTSHTCLIPLHGYFLGWFLICLFILYPLNGHFIAWPWIWKLTCPDPTWMTALVVLKNGLPRRRGTSSLWPISRMTKSVGM